jgi:hypothetical protein
MFTTRPPVGLATLGAAAMLGRARFLRARPQAAAREPHHHRVGVLVVELLEGRLELLAQLRSERRRLPFDDDRPVCEAWRHGSYLLNGNIANIANIANLANICGHFLGMWPRRPTMPRMIQIDSNIGNVGNHGNVAIGPSRSPRAASR